MQFSYLQPKLAKILVKSEANYSLMPETEGGYLSCKKSAGNAVIVIFLPESHNLFCCKTAQY